MFNNHIFYFQELLVCLLLAIFSGGAVFGMGCAIVCFGAGCEVSWLKLKKVGGWFKETGLRGNY